ncbi:hypothetical protein Aab01nite_57030 [Paractinoplanes abujensis]|nr:hypothetical protein Aab01nite_57030 [Actinoplanes abujensis]
MPWELDPRRPHCEPSKHTRDGRGTKKKDPAVMTGSFLVEPRGARSAFAGWDLGRNDHTDEVGRGRPAELDVEETTRFPPYLHVATRLTELRQLLLRPHRRWR